jgi:hypothetical protein
MEPKDIAQRIKLLLAPVAILLAAVYASVLSFFLGAWFKLGLGDAAPEATAAIFAFLGFLGTILVGVWLLGEAD